MIGTRLAHYEVTAHLGSGGMGDVYQATDSKLGRSVAIKVLPEAFIHDADRKARLEREARALAALNHPHIAAIHGLEEFGGRNFLVMELAEGETLAERIARGALPVNEALAIASQVAEGLEAAHEKGLVHRDLKPANIKISSDGRVKVLDFGLAKAFQDEKTEVNRSNSPTLSLAATNAGVILGTAAYMSPEQAKGKAVDRRTDVFSFGCILYEMLTGRPAFDGETVAEILARVLEREPDWKRLPFGLNPRIAEVLHRCLEKDPRKRRRDMGDVLLDLDLPLPLREVAAPPARPVRVASMTALALTVLALLAITYTAYFRFSRVPSDAPEMRVEINTPSTSDPISFAISPDGRSLVFVATGDGQPRLWLRPLDAVTAEVLAGTEGASYPFWSPDSRSIGFFADGKLKRVDLGGGLPQTLTNAVNGRGGTWNSSGVILFSTTGSPILRIPASGGEPVAVTKVVAPQATHRFPQFLPDGRQFLFYAVTVGGAAPEDRGIYLGTLDSSETRRLTAADAAGFYTSGWLLFIRQGTLVARRFDLSRGELTGDPVTIADSVPFDNATLAGAFSISAAGVVAYRTGAASRNQLIWFDRSGKMLGAVGAPDDAIFDPRVSPDGRRVAAARSVQGNLDVWILDAVRTTRFTFDPGLDAFPIWSRDGNSIAFTSIRKGVYSIYQKASNGTGVEEKLLPDSRLALALWDWSADGRFLLYQILEPKNSYDMWILPLEVDRKPRAFLQSQFDERDGRFSPDGRWVAYRSNESGRNEIYVRSFQEPGGQWQISTGGGSGPRWRRDGRELYYIAPDGRLMAVPIASQGATLEPGTPGPLFQTRIVGGDNNAARAQYDVAPDGRFLINTLAGDAVTPPITLLLNWHPPDK